MIIYYRMVGLIADIALLINCIMVVGVLGMFNSVLTLPGIAGLILSLGIAVDANVLIYERLRDEIKQGNRFVWPSIPLIEKRSAAISARATSPQLRPAAILWLASGPGQVALTLTIGIALSSLLVSHVGFASANDHHSLKGSIFDKRYRWPHEAISLFNFIPKPFVYQNIGVHRDSQAENEASNAGKRQDAIEHA